MTLRLLNLSRYETDEVTRLVQYAFDGFDVPASAVTVIVTDAKQGKRREHGVPYSGRASDRTQHTIPLTWKKRMGGRRYLVRVRIGKPEAFPIRPFKRHEVYDYLTWQEALLGIAAHEFQHIQDYHDDVESTEPRCEAIERHTLLRWRAEHDIETPDPGPLVAPWSPVTALIDATHERLACGHVFHVDSKWDRRRQTWVPLPHARKRRCHDCLRERRELHRALPRTG